MAAGAGAHDADALRVDLPLGGFGAREAHGARGVFEHDGMAVAFGAEAVFQDEASDAVFREPLGVALRLRAGRVRRSRRQGR